VIGSWLVTKTRPFETMGVPWPVFGRGDRQTTF